jgi:hypothetical protein
MYLIDIQNPTQRNKCKARTSVFKPQVSLLIKENNQGAWVDLNSMTIYD